MKSNRTRWYLIGIGCFIVLWAVGSWASWSNLAFRPYPIALPFLFLSWPGHEICLVVCGKGMGANANCPATAGTFFVFLAQAVVTWFLLVLCITAPRRKSLWVTLQGVVLVLLFIGFWQWGNG